jgi:hypothetical protein
MRPAREPAPGPVDGEHRFLLEGVPWNVYVALRDALDDAGGGVRMTYLEGRLELMSPSETHDEERKLIARLLETWADERDVDLRGFGSEVHRLSGSAYQRIERSAILPNLDQALLASFVRPGESHTGLAKAYRAALRA